MEAKGLSCVVALVVQRRKHDGRLWRIRGSRLRAGGDSSCCIGSWYWGCREGGGSGRECGEGCRDSGRTDAWTNGIDFLSVYVLSTKTLNKGTD